MWKFRRVRVKLPAVIAGLGIFCLVLQLMIYNKPTSAVNYHTELRNFFRDRLINASDDGQPEKVITGMEALTGSWRKESLIYPAPNLTTRLVTFGIPTVRREKGTYVFKTLESLLNNTKREELDEIYLVIFLADFDKDWRNEVAQQLKEQYPGLIKSGTMQIIEAPHYFYPSLSNLQHTYRDPIMKRKWRSKQNADYAYLFLYSEPLSGYYMQLEDDIYTVPDYISTIKVNIQRAVEGWVCLEFSELGFIGKLYHSQDLTKLAKMTLIFYEEQPVDFTFIHFNIMMLQFNRIIIRPTIFQHRGIQSSLPGKIQPLKDKYFDYVQKLHKGDNPPAEVYTTLKQRPEFPSYMAYSLEDGYFWAQSAPAKGDTITVVFNEPQHISKVIIETGSTEHPTDKLEEGKLEASLTLVNRSENNAFCTNDILLAKFVNGRAFVDNLGPRMGPFKVQCLRITVLSDHKFWLILKEISVFVNKEPALPLIVPAL